MKQMLTKKITWLCIASIFILIPFIYISYQKPQKNTTENKITYPAPTIETNLPQTNGIAPTEYIDPDRRWQTYEGLTFHFQFPQEWRVQTYALSQGGEAVIVRHKALPQGINYPQFILQTERAEENSISKKEGILAGFGLKKSAIKVQGIDAIQYKGTIPFKTVGSQTVNEPIQDTTILLKKNDMVYVLKYEYEGASNNEPLDAFFNGFIESFKPNE